MTRQGPDYEGGRADDADFSGEVVMVSRYDPSKGDQVPEVFLIRDGYEVEMTGPFAEGRPRIADDPGSIKGAEGKTGLGRGVFSIEQSLPEGTEVVITPTWIWHPNVQPDSASGKGISAGVAAQVAKSEPGRGRTDRKLPFLDATSTNLVRGKLSGIKSSISIKPLTPGQ